MYHQLLCTTFYLALIFFPVRSQRTNDDSAVTATIDSGPLIGKRVDFLGSNKSVNQFLGVPFAQPPVGMLRFAPPKAPLPWDNPLDASSQPVGCIQYRGDNATWEMSSRIFDQLTIPGESEDCLYLNIYTPSGGPADKAVLFWIYGGSYTSGAVSQSIYDGTSFAANHDIVVVAANYRVNVFGYPRSPQLPSGERNLGILDQLLALDWVQRNIRTFGGDPKKVTIMGESAGAVSVGHFINIFPDNPPFRAGVLQSGSAVFTLPTAPPNNDSSAWDLLIQLLDCNQTADEAVLACMRTTPAEQIQQVMESNSLLFSEPYRDNVTALEYPALEWLTGNVAHVPILIGSTAQDGSVFTLAAGDDVNSFIDSTFGQGNELARTISQLYAPNSPATAELTNGEEIIAQIITDAIFRCSSGFAANMTATLLGQPVWQYVFDALVPSNTWEQYPDLGVYHSSEIPLVFGTYPRENTTAVEARLSNSMQKQFADFINDPNSGPGWDQWPQVAMLTVNESDPVVVTEHALNVNAVCLLWDQLYSELFLGPLAISSGNLNETDDTDSARSESAAGRYAVSGAYIVGGLLLVAIGLP